jgi:hypothetical protein
LSLFSNSQFHDLLVNIARYYFGEPSFFAGGLKFFGSSLGLFHWNLSGEVARAIHGQKIAVEKMSVGRHIGE